MLSSETLNFIAIPTTFIVGDLFWWIAMDQRLRPLRHARLWRALTGGFAALMALYVVLLLATARAMPGVFRASSSPVPMAVHTLAYLWHLLGLGMLGLLVTARWCLDRLAWLGRQLLAMGRPTTVQAPPALGALAPVRGPTVAPGACTRRQILSAAALAAPPLAMGGLSVLSTVHMRDHRLRRFSLALPTLPPQLDGVRIVQVSDTHIGKFLHPSLLPSIASSINALNADFVVFTGDLIDISLEDLPHGIRFLRQLRSRCGLVACEGNHDIMQDRGEFADQMLDSGIPLIIGGQLTLPYRSPGGKEFPVQFLATPWNMTDEFMAEAVKLLEPAIRYDAFPILLAHHPHHFDAATHADIPLVLAGHTHGGQIMLTETIGGGPLRFRYVSGLYQRNGSNLIVNNGLGNWFPLRINAPAEIIEITLHTLS